MTNIHEQMIRKNIIIENLDYKELIKKYNGKEYINKEGNKVAEKEFADQTKLWYFDPPYHPYTLWEGKEAIYGQYFSVGDVREFVSILAGKKEDEYGKIEYFLKSDYNPKNNILKYEKNKSRAINNKNFQTRMNKQINLCNKAYSDFDLLEENDKASSSYKENQEEVTFYIDCLGEFEKMASDSTTGDAKQTGIEFLWCRGNYTGDEYKDGVLVKK